jgi:cbb3-type cytochrome oxidase subunit 3
MGADTTVQASFILAAASGRFIVTPPNYALYGWLVFGALVMICVIAVVLRRQGRSRMAEWERAKAEAQAMQNEAARQRSSEEMHEELKRRSM